MQTDFCSQMQSFPCKVSSALMGPPDSLMVPSQRGNNRDRFGCGALTGRFLQGRPAGSAAFLPLQNRCCFPVILFPDPGRGQDLLNPGSAAGQGLKSASAWKINSVCLYL